MRVVVSTQETPGLSSCCLDGNNMKVVALISGGKDSCFNMMQCVSEGHQIVALANLAPAEKDEVDSYMYQTVGHEGVQLYSEAMHLPLFRRTLEGQSLETGRDYRVNPRDEVEDLYQLLHSVKEQMGVEAVSVGAILSDYQRVRVENVCCRLGLRCLAFLWRRDQEQLLREMIACHLHAVIIKVASLGLEPDKHLGKDLAQMQGHLTQMNKKYGLNVCGEGGEYETFTLDCPLFTKRIVIDHRETIIHSNDAFAPVGYLKLREMHLEEKAKLGVPIEEYLRSLPMKLSSQLYSELAEYPTADEVASIEEIPPDPITIFAEMAAAIPTDSQSGEGIGACKCRIGPYLWVTGIQALSTPMGSLETSVDSAMKCLKDELEIEGMGLKDAVFVSLFVRDMREFAQINQVYSQYFGLNPPARACVEVDLSGEGALLRLDCLACHHPSVRHMHVQSLSHWASANIGPYSQAVQSEELIFVAGQIALVPSTLALVKDGGHVSHQAHLSLRHVQRVLAAMHAGTDLDCVVQALAYVTQPEDMAIVRSLWKAALNCPTQEEAKWGREESSGERFLPELALAVVPHLPKEARVEWQMVAVTPALSQLWTSCQEVSKVVEGCRIHSQACGSQERGSVVTLRVTAGVDTILEVTQLELEPLLAAMMECLWTARSRLLNGRTADDSNSSDGGLMAIRILYSQHILADLSATTINSVFQRIWLTTAAAGKGDAGSGSEGATVASLPVAATIVPVTSLSGNLLIEFSALHFS